MKKQIKKIKEDDSGLFIPAGLFVGLGFGSIFNNWVAGTLFGLGLGFLGTAVVRAWKRSR